MVSNASEDFPEPLTPVTTVMALCGISTLIFFRLWTRAPRTRMDSCSVRTSVGAWVISLVAKGSLDSTFREHCLNFKLYVRPSRLANRRFALLQCVQSPCPFAQSVDPTSGSHLRMYAIGSAAGTARLHSGSLPVLARYCLR